MNNPRRLYDILEVPQDASPAQIRDQYKKLARKYHPDKNPANAEESNARFKEISQAYQILSDETKRYHYDKYGEEQVDGSSDEVSLFTKAIFSALIEGIFCIFEPFEIISSRMKFAVGPTTPSVLETTHTIYSERGVTGFWSGTSVRLLRSLVSSSIVNSLGKKELTMPLLPLSVSAMVTYPLQVLTTCMRLHLVEGLTVGILAITRNKGVYGLYSALLPVLIQNVVHIVGTYLLESSSMAHWMQNKVKEKMDKGQVGFGTFLEFSFTVLKITLLNLLTCPFRTLAVRLQGAAALQNAVVAPSSRIIDVVRKESASRLYSGFFLDILYQVGNNFLDSLF